MRHPGDDLGGRRIGRGRSTGRLTRLVGRAELGEGGASRREFLRATAAAIGSLLLPGGLRAGDEDESFWFIHIVTGDSWPVADPVVWSLDNANRSILERASEGLRRLTPADGERTLRLVVRRCALNLIEIHPDRVVVHHWGQQGRADLRAFFRAQGMARRDVEVVVRDRKREEISTQTGDDYRYGEALATDFPLDLYLSRWKQRFVHRPDDRLAAPGSSSGYAWEGTEDDRIPWAALKSAWRRTGTLRCSNCDGPTLLTNFGYRRTGMFSRSTRFVHVCGPCRRSFEDSVKDVPGWMLTNLDAEFRPAFEVVWNRRIVLEPGESSRPIDEPWS